MGLSTGLEGFQTEGMMEIWIQGRKPKECSVYE
jgi:hypothetical protein